jgi:CheY-like chemotaxis protein
MPELGDHGLQTREGTAFGAPQGPTKRVDLFRKSIFDVILMDVEMPELDGHATTRSIRQHTGTMKDVPIIALTGHDSAEKNADCFAAGMNAIVHKPIKSEHLKATILDALKHRV